jgi:hypothetical protein
MKQEFFARIVRLHRENAYDKEIERLQTSLVEGMSPLCRTMYEHNPNAVRQQYLFILGGKTVVVGDADVDRISAPYREKENRYRELEAQIKEAVKSCSTDAQLRKIFPAFEEHINQLVTKKPSEIHPSTPESIVRAFEEYDALSKSEEETSC